MKLKFVPAAVLSLAAMASGAVHADSVTDLGLITSLKSFGGGSLPGVFNDIFTFELAANGGSQYTVADFSVPFLPVSTLFATFAVVSNSDGILFNGDDTPLNIVSFQSGAPTASLSIGNTTGGKYYLWVSGLATGSAGGIYSGAVSVSAVPEPETYAMMLAGLAALGFLARRRQG